ncbi:MAG: hypothetical protein AAGK32_15745 [Actinomycetota bacterium]
MLILAQTDAVDDPLEEITSSVRDIWQSAVDAVPRIGIAIMIVIVGWAISRLVRMLLTRSLSGRHTPSFSRVMSKVVGWLVLFVFVLAAMATAFPSVKPVDLLAGLGSTAFGRDG